MAFNGTIDGAQEIALRNSSTGTGAFARLSLGNDGEAGAGRIVFFGTGFPPSNPNLADSLTIQSTRVNGISIASTNASGDIRFFAGGTTEVGRIDSTAWFINDTANANNTFGLTVNQVAATNHAITLKGSGSVLTGITSIVAAETDDFASFLQTNGGAGGLGIRSLGENAANAVNTSIVSYGGQASTTHSTAGRALIELYVSQHDGANAAADVTNDGNVFGVRYRTGAADVTGLILDEDGDLWLNGGLTATTGTFSSTLSATATTVTTLETGQGANELYDMDQDVLTTSAPTFATINTGNGAVELAAGVYTPTYTSVANVDSSTPYECQYERVGNTVTTSCLLNVDATTSGVLVQIQATLPVASNLGASQDSVGTATATSVAAFSAGTVLGDLTTDRVQIEYLAPSAANHTVTFIFTYQVI